MKKLVSVGIAGATAVGLAFASAGTAAAGSYTSAENRAWSMAKEFDPFGTRIMGKERTVDYMNFICGELDDGSDYLDISERLITTAMEADMTTESRDGFINWGSTAAGAAVIEICDDHLEASLEAVSTFA